MNGEIQSSFKSYLFQSPERFCYNALDTPPDSPTSMLTAEDGREISSIQVSVTYKDGSKTVTGYKPNMPMHNPTIENGSFDHFRYDRNATKSGQFSSHQDSGSKKRNHSNIGEEESFDNLNGHKKRDKMVFEMKEAQEFPQESSFLTKEGIWVVQKNTDREGLFAVGLAESDNLINAKLPPYDIKAQYEKDIYCHGGDATAEKRDNAMELQTEPLCLSKKRPESACSVQMDKKANLNNDNHLNVGNSKSYMPFDEMKFQANPRDPNSSNLPATTYMIQSHQNSRNHCNLNPGYNKVGYLYQPQSGYTSLQAVEDTKPPTQQYETVMVATKCSPNAFLDKEDESKGEKGNNHNINGISNGFIPTPRTHDYKNFIQCCDSQRPYQQNHPTSNTFQKVNLDCRNEHSTHKASTTVQYGKYLPQKSNEHMVDRPQVTKDPPQFFITPTSMGKTRRKGLQTNKDDRERAFVCNFPTCNKSYLKSSHLKAHYRVHTGKIISM